MMVRRCSLWFLITLGAVTLGQLTTNTPLAQEKAPPAQTTPLRAGVAKVEITNKEVLPSNDPLYVKVLVLEQGDTKAVLITLDVVAIEEIGPIKGDYLRNVRAKLKADLGIAPTRVIVNASHCHGVVCADVDAKTVEAVKLAAKNMVPVKVGVGIGHEDRIQANRRLRLKSGKTIDERHAYSLPADEEVAGVGPIDPQIGVLRLDKLDGDTLAVVYNFACHPIMGVPNGGNSADLVGFASKVIEENLDEGTIALFVQGCGGDINPVGYKEVHQPRSAEPLGHKLGLSVLRAVRKIECDEGGPLKVVHEKVALPRANLQERIDSMVLEQATLMKSLRGTSLNLKSFLPLVVKYNLAEKYPSQYAHGYLHEEMLGRDALVSHDKTTRRNLDAYIHNIHIMEQLTRVQTNLALLQKHHKRYLEAERKPIEVEMCGLRVGNFVLVTFPGELTVEIGLKVKKKSPHMRTFVAGYTNGYIYYTPTAEQLRNVGNAQEDSDCLVAPEWEAIFHAKVSELLKKL